MLVNGTTLKFSATSGGTYTELAGLKEVPDVGAEPEMVDNTALSDAIVHNEVGIGDPGDMEYTFRYSKENYAACHALEGTKQYFDHILKDGTSFKFEAIPTTRISGGGVNDPQEFVMALALQSDITVTEVA